MARASIVESSVPEPIFDEPDGEIDDAELPPDEPADDPAATEAHARAMGWKPLHEYRGPPGKWRDAAEFIRIGETQLPVIRDQNQRLTEKIGRLEGELTSMRLSMDEQKQVLEDMRNLARTADKRGYDRAMAEIEKKKREAVAAGDTESYDQLVEQAEALEEAHEEAAPGIRPPAPAPQPITDPDVVAFLQANPWFKTDPFLSQQMVANHAAIIRKHPAMPEAERLELALQGLKADFPDSFGLQAPPAPRPPAQPPAPRRPRAAIVAAPTPGNDGRPQPGAQMTINSIQDPNERVQARDAFNRMKRQIPDYTEAEYMKIYADPHNDVLEMQSEARKRPNGR